MDNLVLQIVERTPQVMQDIPNDEGAVVEWESRRIYSKDQIVFPQNMFVPKVFLDGDRVEVRAQEFVNGGIEVSDVLVGPLNLES